MGYAASALEKGQGVSVMQLQQFADVLPIPFFLSMEINFMLFIFNSSSHLLFIYLFT